MGENAAHYVLPADIIAFGPGLLAPCSAPVAELNHAGEDCCHCSCLAVCLHNSLWDPIVRRLHTGAKPAQDSADVVPPLPSWVFLLQSQEPNQQEIAQKEQLIASLNRLVQPGLGEYTGMHVEPYGSFTSGLSNQGGDLDLAVEGKRTGRG